MPKTKSPKTRNTGALNLTSPKPKQAKLNPRKVLASKNTSKVQVNAESTSEWKGAVFMRWRRIIFVGEAGTAENQNIHAIKICIALNGDFKLSTDSGVRHKPCSAVIINAGVTHTIECGRNKIFLLYLLPETREARDLRREYLYDGRGQFYDIPKKLINESLPLQQILRSYENWHCQDVFNVCEEVVAGLGRIRHRQLSTSSNLSDEIGESVKQTIEYIYDKLEAGNFSGEFNKEKFNHAAFKKETGISIERFLRDIQMLSALKFYANEEWFAKAPQEERELVAKLDDPTLTEEEKAGIRDHLNTMPHRVLLTNIAASLGFRSLALFGFRIKSRLGISMADLRGNTNFYSCSE
jgi:AraC-like DNA-binding protein